MTSRSSTDMSALYALAVEQSRGGNNVQFQDTLLSYVCTVHMHVRQGEGAEEGEESQRDTHPQEESNDWLQINH